MNTKLQTYKYLGDRLTSDKYKNSICRSVLRKNGKCIRSKMGTMLVEFDNHTKVIVLARRLRKI